MGGMGGMGGGGPMGGAQAPEIEERPKFRDHVNSIESMGVRREKGDAVVGDVRVTGNRRVATATIFQELQTRPTRFYDYETVLSDVRRLNDMGSFDMVTFRTEKTADAVDVTFVVHERPIVTRVIMHGNRAINDRELSARSGVAAGDPMSEFAIESGRRRLQEYYREEGFNHATVQTTIGTDNDPSMVIFRINEAHKERIKKITIKGASIVGESRLKKIIKSRGYFGGVFPWAMNVLNLDQIDSDVDTLARYLHDLGHLTATVGRRIEYDPDGKWATVHFRINEGPRYKVNDIQIVGNQFVTTESLMARLKLRPGEFFDGNQLRKDIGEVIYGMGDLGFIYSEVDPKTVMRDDAPEVDVVLKVVEGDRYRIRRVAVNIEGDPYLMKNRTVLNRVDLREGDYINLRSLEAAQASLMRTQLFETDPQVADPPDIRVEPVEDDR